jgi:hypothetical protein
MKMLSIIAIFLLLSSVSVAWGEEEERNTLLVIQSITLPSTFTAIEKVQSDKIILKASTRIKDYQVMIGEFDQSLKIKYPIHLVSVKVFGPKKQMYTIEARLFNETSKKLISKIVVENVEKLAFFRELEKVLTDLFLPVDKEVVPKPPRPKNTKAQQELSRKDAAAIAASVEFRERIMSLKNSVDQRVIEIKEEKARVARSSSNSNFTESTSQNPQSSASPGNSLELELPAIKKPVAKFHQTNHQLGLFFMQSNTNYSDVIIDVDTQALMGGGQYDFFKKISENSSWFFKSQVKLGKVMNSKDIEFSPYINTWGSLAYNWEDRSMMSFIGLELDTLYFTNIVNIGDGLQNAESRILNIRLSHEISSELFGQPLKFGAYIARPMYVNSANERVGKSTIDGNKYGAVLTFADLYGRLNFGAEVFISSYTFKTDLFNLETSTKGLGFNANYIF